MALNKNQQIIELIEKSHHILLTTAITNTGDGLSSALAFKALLDKIGKPTDIVVTESQKEKLSFLPGADKIKSKLGSLKKLVINLDISKNKVGEFNYDISDDKLKIFVTPENGTFSENDIKIESSDYKYDLIITFGSPDLESLGSLYESHTDFFFNTTIINIDNDASNDHYGQVNLVELNFSSVAEIIFDLIESINPEHLTDQTATHLLTGLIIKTNSFRASHISPKALITASHLLKLGADRDFIINNLNRNKNLPTLNLWGRVLARLKTDSHYKFAWSMLSQTDFQKSGAGPENLDGVVSELIVNSPTIENTLILYESAEGNIKGILYTSPNFNSLDLARPFNPEGHKNKAEFSLESTRLMEIEAEVIDKIRNRIKTIE
jgi:bifunctional oligoribonuclease and PAP phosphatase NrnA